MIRYPNGEAYSPKDDKDTRKTVINTQGLSNRGMGLEDDISSSSEIYNSLGRCLIYKRPTPIRVVRMDKINKTKISEAYFSAKSTTDYNGIYREKYLDFEAKETISKTSFAFGNIRPQQITHLKGVVRLGGIAFFIIRMKAYSQTYLLNFCDIGDLLDNSVKRSFPYSLLKEKGHLIKESFSPRLMYLDTVDEVFFSSPYCPTKQKLK